jgi:predicted nucleotidyltransferase
VKETSACCVNRGESSDESDIDVMIEVRDTNPEIEAQIDNMIFGINQILRP